MLQEDIQYLYEDGRYVPLVQWTELATVKGFGIMAKHVASVRFLEGVRQLKRRDVSKSVAPDCLSLIREMIQIGAHSTRLLHWNDEQKRWV